MGLAHSVPILTAEEENLSLDAEVVNSILDQVGDRPFVLISINGPTRTGKSFVLTKFLSYLNAKKNGTEESGAWVENQMDKHFSFDWRGGSTRNTSGINMWSQPIITTIKGKEIAILLMDTQGSFDECTTADHNAKIFAISTLFSSVFIFNAVRDLREDTLQFFQLFSGYAKMIGNGAGAKDDESSEEKSVEEIDDQSTNPCDVTSAPKLIFLLRDVEFRDYEYGYYDNSHCPLGQEKNLKVELLNPKGNQPREVKRLRKDIISTYEDIGVFTLPHPGKELAMEDRLDKLDPEFKMYLQKFVEFIFRKGNLKLKDFGGIPVTGNDFKKYVVNWARDFSGVEIPQVNTVYNTAAEMQNRIAMEKGMAKFQEMMDSFVGHYPTGAEDQVLDDFHLGAEKEAVSVFHKQRCLGGDVYEREYLENLKEEMRSGKTRYFDSNRVKREREERRLREEAEIRRLEEESRNRRREAEELRAEAEREARKLARELEEARRERNERQRRLDQQREEEERRRRRAMQEARDEPWRGIGNIFVPQPPILRLARNPDCCIV